MPPGVVGALQPPGGEMELGDRGLDPGLAAVREQHATMLFDWIRSRQIHPTVSAQSMADWTDKEFRIGIQIGAW